MADLTGEKFLLHKQLQEQIAKVKFLNENKNQLEEQLKQSEEFVQRLVNYLIISANQQEKLEKELEDLKLLFLQMEIEKRKKEEDFNQIIEEINDSLQNLSI